MYLNSSVLRDTYHLTNSIILFGDHFMLWYKVAPCALSVFAGIWPSVDVWPLTLTSDHDTYRLLRNVWTRPGVSSPLSSFYGTCDCQNITLQYSTDPLMHWFNYSLNNGHSPDDIYHLLRIFWAALFISSWLISGAKYFSSQIMNN